MNSRITPLVALPLAVLAFAACAPTAEPDVLVRPTAPPTATATAEERVQASREQAEAAIERRDAQYREAVAAWPEPTPAGYSWPASVRDLPPGAVGQQRELQEPRNVYRCMLIDAIWIAYFQDNDAEASLALAARADELWDGSMSSVNVLNDHGTILAQNLATANGICHSAVGDLKS